MGVIDPGTGGWISRYIGSLIYSGSNGSEALDGIQTEDGFIDCSGGVSNAQMQYFLRDHLGSVRVVAADRNTVLSRTDYLPFGARMTGNGLPESATARSVWFGFSGKENEKWDAASGTQHWLRGERWQHFGARAYGPATCIWTGIDPLAEKYPGVSPYAYCKGDPINRIDPDGMTDWDKIVGAVVGVVTNIIPGTGFVRDWYQPEDKADYNHGLKTSDDASMVVGAVMVAAGGALDAAGGTTVATGTLACATGVGAPAGTVAVVGGAAEITTGEALAATGSMMLANTSDNVKQGYERGKNQSSGEHIKPASANQIQSKIKKGQAPISFKAAHNAHTPNGQEHIHLKNGSSFNKDGSLHDKGKYKGNLTNEERCFIKKQGWIVPKQ